MTLVTLVEHIAVSADSDCRANETGHQAATQAHPSQLRPVEGRGPRRENPDWLTTNPAEKSRVVASSFGAPVALFGFLLPIVQLSFHQNRVATALPKYPFLIPSCQVRQTPSKPSGLVVEPGLLAEREQSLVPG